MAYIRIVIVVLASLWSTAISHAEFKTFDQIDKEDPQPTPNRLADIDNLFSRYQPFTAMSAVDKRTAYYIAASYVAMKTCGVAGAHGAIAYPAWIKNAILGSSLIERVPQSPAFSDRDVITWAIVGRMLDDAKPCELAETIVRHSNK